LFGVAIYGGAKRKGTLFEVTPKGTFTVLHAFDHSDGGFPTGGLIENTSGAFYGVAESGGNGHCSGGCGTIYEFKP
jgi:uncharacterized repeat protein (TIGR03803 family)